MIERNNWNVWRMNGGKNDWKNGDLKNREMRRYKILNYLVSNSVLDPTRLSLNKMYVPRCGVGKREGKGRFQYSCVTRSMRSF